MSKVHRVTPSAQLGECYRKVWAKGFVSFLERQLDALRLNKELDILAIADDVRAMQVGPVGPAWPVVLHGDLEPAHVYWDGDHVTAVIDFGDAKLGDPLYDFVALRLGMSDRPDELAEFSRGYGTASFSLQDGRLRLLQYALLHEWTTASDISRWCAKSGARSLSELGTWLFP
jgi:aminoglycoside phosphotransferase (APT) family kinase protein